jgi:hypothetical protein
MKVRLGEVWLSHSDRGCQYSAIVTRECSPHAGYAKAEALVIGSNRFDFRLLSRSVAREAHNTRGRFLSTIDGHIRSSERYYRFSDLTKDLRSLKSKVENYRLVREIVEKEG